MYVLPTLDLSSFASQGLGQHGNLVFKFTRSLSNGGKQIKLIKVMALELCALPYPST